MREFVNPRILKDYHDKDDIFGYILIYTKGDLNSIVKRYKTIYFGDIMEDSEYNLNWLGEGDCKVIFKNYDLFYEILNIVDPIAIEIVNPENPDTSIRKNYNLFYFYTSFSDKFDYVENSGEKSISFKFFTEFIEKNIIVEHTKTYENIEVGETPDDFNKIKFTKKKFHEIINDCIYNNLLNPVTRNNGGTHSRSDNRGFYGINKYIFSETYRNLDISLLEDKKSLFDIKKMLYDILKDKEYAGIPIPHIEIKNGKFEVDFKNRPEGIYIDKFDKDVPSKYEINQSTEEIRYNILIEGSDPFQWFTQSQKFRNDWIAKELLETQDTSTSENSGDAFDEMETKYFEVLPKNGFEDDSLINFLMSQHTFFNGVHPGQYIYIENQGILDGRWQILNLSVKVKNTYNEYSLDDLKRY